MYGMTFDGILNDQQGAWKLTLRFVYFGSVK
jgi:hypothetical protein